MRIQGINHLAFITDDMTKTVRFYRDLLGLRLVAGVGHGGYRHYFFRMGEGQVAFFEYEGASPMRYGKFHGDRTREPIGFDHVAFTVESRDALFDLKDRLEAAGCEVHGPIDHGIMWSIYFFDPNGIPLEAAWDCVELVSVPAIHDEDPLAVAAEGAEPQPGHWPEVREPTPPERRVARPGNGHVMRDDFVRRGLARPKPELAPEPAESD